MSDIPADPQPDLARLLPREAFGEIIVILRGALPPPTSEEPAAQVRRDRAAMAAVASLRPENAAEGRLAAQFVAADAWAMDCLRQVSERWRETDVARQCRAQAMGMMREGKSALRLTRFVQRSTMTNFLLCLLGAILHRRQFCTSLPDLLSSSEQHISTTPTDGFEKA